MQNNLLSFNRHCSALRENWRNGIDVIFHYQLLWIAAVVCAEYRTLFASMKVNPAVYKEGDVYVHSIYIQLL